MPVVENAVRFELFVRLDSEICITPVGALDAATVTGARGQLEALLGAGFSRVLVDVRRLAADDETTVALIGWLDRAARRDRLRLSLVDEPSTRHEPSRPAGAPLALVDRAEQCLADGRVVEVVSEPATIRWTCPNGEGSAHPAVEAGALGDAIADTLGYALYRPPWIRLLATAIVDPDDARRDTHALTDDTNGCQRPPMRRSAGHGLFAGQGSR